MLDSTLASNTVVRKYKTKLISRAGLRMIPTKPQLDDGADVPDTIEQILEQLFESLQDKVKTTLLVCTTLISFRIR